LWLKGLKFLVVGIRILHSLNNAYGLDLHHRKNSVEAVGEFGGKKIKHPFLQQLRSGSVVAVWVH
jgi:hypothetical protein